MGGSIAYVFRNGQRMTAWMLYVINLLDADLFAAFGVHVIVSSAIRTYAEQERIFRARYVTAGNVNGRRVYDTRVWKGVRWYRISSAGTVAVPGSSNHEIQGSRAAVDIRDTGSDAGITVASSARGRWIRDWCRRTGLLVASGDGFGEGWHFDVPNIFKTPPAGKAETMNVRDFFTFKFAGTSPGTKNDGLLPKSNSFASWVRYIARRVEVVYMAVRVGESGKRTDGLLTALIKKNFREIKATQAAHTAALDALTTGQGLDPGDLTKLVAGAVAASLEDATLKVVIPADADDE